MRSQSLLEELILLRKAVIRQTVDEQTETQLLLPPAPQGGCWGVTAGLSPPPAPDPLGGKPGPSRSVPMLRLRDGP